MCQGTRSAVAKIAWHTRHPTPRSTSLGAGTRRVPRGRRMGAERQPAGASDPTLGHTASRAGFPRCRRSREDHVTPVAARDVMANDVNRRTAQRSRSSETLRSRGLGGVKTPSNPTSAVSTAQAPASLSAWRSVATMTTTMSTPARMIRQRRRDLRLPRSQRSELMISVVPKSRSLTLQRRSGACCALPRLLGCG